MSSSLQPSDPHQDLEEAIRPLLPFPSERHVHSAFHTIYSGSITPWRSYYSSVWRTNGNRNAAAHNRSEWLAWRRYLYERELVRMRSNSAHSAVDLWLEAEARDVLRSIQNEARNQFIPWRSEPLWTSVGHEDEENEERTDPRVFSYRHHGTGTLDLASLEDVPLVPDGPEIPTADYTTLVRGLSVDATCNICLEEPDESGLVVPHGCQHTFHLSCIHEWINGVTQNSNKCPVCRKEICDQRRSWCSSRYASRRGFRTQL